MRGVGILDMFMVLFAIFLLLALVIAVGLIGPSGSTVFSVDVDDALLVFERAQYGKPVHELLAIEQFARAQNTILDDEMRSIAESIDRHDRREGDVVVPPQVAWLEFLPQSIPNLDGLDAPFDVTIGSEDASTRTIAPKRQGSVRWVVQIDEDSRFRVGPSSTGQGNRGGVIEYALE